MYLCVCVFSGTHTFCTLFFSVQEISNKSPLLYHILCWLHLGQYNLFTMYILYMYMYAYWYVCIGNATRLCEAVGQWAAPNVINCVPEEYDMLLQTVSYL